MGAAILVSSVSVNRYIIVNNYFSVIIFGVIGLCEISSVLRSRHCGRHQSINIIRRIDLAQGRVEKYLETLGKPLKTNFHFEFVSSCSWEGSYSDLIRIVVDCGK